jgi:hypothetical protein
MKVIRLLPALLLAALCTSGAAVIPYTNNFSGTGSNTAFTTEMTNAEWTVTGTSYAFSYSNSTVTPSLASISISNMANTAFTMETQIKVVTTGSINSNNATVGFGAFGATSGFGGSGSSSAYYLADWQVGTFSDTAGTLRILSLGEAGGFTAINASADNNAASNLAVTLGTTYTLRLTGVYVGTTLNLTLGVYDATGTTQIGTSATATDTSPLTGTNFGYRNRIGVGSGTFTADYNNFSIVPEPTAAGLLALGGTVVMALRRRTKTV